MKKTVLTISLISTLLVTNGQVIFNEFNLSSNNSRDTKVADIDNDGDKDIIMIDRDSQETIIWYENIGNGSFSSERVIYDSGAAWNTYEKMEIVDVDNDGDLDIIAGGLGYSFQVFINDGVTNFTIESSLKTNTTEGTQIVSIDVNNDLYPEIIGESKIFDNSVGIFDTVGTLVNAGTSIYSCVSNDFDGDGYEDIVAFEQYDDRLILMTNNTIGGFDSPIIIDDSLDFGYYHISMSDLDGDGKKDVLYPSSDYFNNSSNRLFWYKSNGDGSFIKNELLVVDTNYVVTYLYGIDMDNDGDNDLLSSMYNDITYKGLIKCYWNDGNNNFDSSNYQIITTSIEYPNFLCADDIDGDGDNDAVTATFYGNGGMSWFQNQTIPNNTGITESTMDKLLTFPNPTNGQITIELEGLRNNVEIIQRTLTGQIVNKQIISSMSRADFEVIGSKGIYFLDLKTEEGETAKIKVIKQ